MCLLVRTPSMIFRTRMVFFQFFFEVKTGVPRHDQFVFKSTENDRAMVKRKKDTENIIKTNWIHKTEKEQQQRGRVSSSFFTCGDGRVTHSWIHLVNIHKRIKGDFMMRVEGLHSSWKIDYVSINTSMMKS